VTVDRSHRPWSPALALALAAAVSGCNSSDDAGPRGAGGSQVVPTLGNGGQPAAVAGNAPAGGAGSSSGSVGVGGSAGATAGGAKPSGGANAQAGSVSTAGTGGTDAAEAGAGGSGGDGAELPGVTGVIAVGYGGLRVVSRDLGKTWTNETHWAEDGKDDDDLLRTIAYGNGLWLSAGWRLVTSADGVSWDDHGMAEDVITAINCPVTDGLAFGAGKFLVACGSNLASSSDGLQWTKVTRTPDVGGHPYLIWDEAEQQFVCSGDDGPSFVSHDGASWTKISIVKAHLCAGEIKAKTECASFHTQGVFLTTEWGGVIRRSTDGSKFEKTYQDQFDNNLFTEYSFGVGRVAP
jgi:hypothetical protein